VNYIKTRTVRARIYGIPRTFEASIISRQAPGAWRTLARTRGHLTTSDAVEAAWRLAARRGIKLVDDPNGSALRAIEFSDRHGDDGIMTKNRSVGRPSLGRTDTVKVEVKLPEANRRRWQKAADAAGVPLSAWIRTVCDASA
jgi:hypothetical protein